MKKLVIAGILIATLSGCATKNLQTLSLSPQIAEKYRGKSITYTLRDKPGFLASTAGNAAFGTIGVAGMYSKGNGIIKKNAVEDPSDQIRDALIKDLAGKYGLIIKNPIKRTNAKTPEDTASEHSYADLVLDIKTKGWGFGYRTFDWNNYWVTHSAELRLIDTRTASTLATDSNFYYSGQDNHYPSYKELVSDNAAGLKKELKNAEAKELTEFRQSIFPAR